MELHYHDVEILPETLAASEGPSLSIADTTPEAIASALRSRQAAGGRLEEKVDGCWVQLAIDEAGRVAAATSRAGLPLRYAHQWLGMMISPRLAGWLIIGEVERGTTRARLKREDEWEDLGDYPMVWTHTLVRPDGSAIDGDEGAAIVARVCRPALCDRIRPINAALPGEDWGDFALSVLKAGGEGCVLKATDGHWYKAKLRLEIDRVVLRTVRSKSREGKVITQLEVGYCRSAGETLRFTSTQKVALPAKALPSQLPRGTVVVVLGSDVDRFTGVIRHARIIDARDDKSPSDCRII